MLQRDTINSMGKAVGPGLCLIITVSRTQGSNLVVRRDRWIVKIVIVVVVLAFVGLSVAPLIGSVFQSDQAPMNATSQVSTSAASAELKARAHGYESVLEREPENQTALTGLLEAQLRMGDVQGALQPLEKLAELNPETTDYSILLAEAKEHVGNLEAAEQVYRSLLDSQPGNVRALQEYVDFLQRQQRPEEAISLLEDTLQTAATINQAQAGAINIASVQLILGQTYAEQERFEDAIALYDQAMQANPVDWRLPLAKGKLLQQQGRSEAAQEWFAQAEALAPAPYKDQIKRLTTEDLAAS